MLFAGSVCFFDAKQAIYADTRTAIWRLAVSWLILFSATKMMLNGG